MRTQRIFILSILCALACLLGVGAAVASGGRRAVKKEATKCEIATAAFNAKWGQELKAFHAQYAGQAFEPMRTAQAIGQKPGKVSSPQEWDQVVKSKYFTLDPEQKRAVWLAKLNALEEIDYTPAQWAFIQGQKEVVAGLKFDGTDDVKELSEKMKDGFDLFGKRQFFQIFGALRPRTGDVDAGKIKAKPEGEVKVIKASANFQACTCAAAVSFDDFCSWWYGPTWRCVQNHMNCGHTGGCGWYFTAICDGLCRGD